MRRKNGYTLTEILVVVLLLSIVGGIIIFNVNVVLNNNKNKSYEKYIAQVKSSAETYASLNLDAINELYEDKSFTYVTVGDLIDHGFLDEKLTNPYTGEKIPRNDLVKLSLSTETGYLSIMYPVEEEHKEVFLSSVVLSNTVGKQVDCMDGIGTYTLALSDETGKLILDKDTLLNDYKFSCKLPDGFTKTAGTMNNEVGTTDQVGTYEMTYTWTSKSGTTGTGKRYLKVVPGTITVTYNVDILEGKPADAWTPATCMGTISPTGVCTKDILIGYNYNTLSRPYRRGYILYGWFNEKQTDAENPGNGQEIKDTTKVLLKEDHTIYAHWQRKEYNVLLDSTLNDRPAVNPGTTSLTAKYNLYLDDITIPRRYYDIIFNKNDISESNGTTAATISDSNLVATWDFLGYYSTANDMYIDANGKGVKLWDIDEATTLYSKWDNGRITLPSASRPGYEFDGWYTGVNSTTKRDNNYQYEMPATLYAHWNPIVYDVNLDYNDHDGGSTFAKEPQKNITVTFDDYFSQLFNLTRTGYTFDGWYYEDTTKIETSTKATNDYKIIDNNGISLKAKWNKNQYTVTLDTNKQSAMSNNITLPGSNTYQMIFDESNNNIVQVPSVTGWTFDGWYTSDNVKVYNSDGSYNRDVLTYFDKDGEWVYTDNITLYAHWSQKKYTLTLDLNRQTNMSSTPAFSSTHSNTYEMTYDSASNNTIVKGVVTGWTFDGWFDSNNVKVFDASGKYIESTQAQYFKNGRWNYEGDLTVYAHWSQKTLHTTLNTNKPNNMSSTPSVTPNTYANVFDEDGRKKVATASATGWTFTGWYNSDNELVYDKNGNYNDSITKYINSSGKWIYDGPLELFAHWSANQYTVTFNKSNGSGGTDSILATYDSKFSTIVIPSRDGYTFDGYYTGTNGSGTKYVDNIGQCVKTWTIASDTTLYANWKANQYTITFNKQNGTGGSDNVKATYDSPIPDITTPSRSYNVTFNANSGSVSPTSMTATYTFNGYYTGTNGSGTQYIKSNGKSAKNWDKASAATLYAYWTGGAITLPTPSRTGYSFDGWYTSQTGGTKVGGAGAPYTPTSATTLFAHWTAKTYDVNYSREGGTGGPDSAKATYDQVLPSLDSIPIRSGYDFGGYYTAQDGNGTQYINLSGTGIKKWDIDSNTTLYAKWLGLDDYYGSGNTVSPEAAETWAANLRDQGYKVVTYGASISYWDTRAPSSTDTVRIGNRNTWIYGTEEIHYNGDDARNSASQGYRGGEPLLGWDFNGASMIVAAGATVEFEFSFQADCVDSENGTHALCSDIDKAINSIDLFVNGNTVGHWQENNTSKSKIVGHVISYTNNTGATQEVYPRGHMELHNNSDLPMMTTIYTYCHKK